MGRGRGGRRARFVFIVRVIGLFAGENSINDTKEMVHQAGHSIEVVTRFIKMVLIEFSELWAFALGSHSSHIEALSRKGRSPF